MPVLVKMPMAKRPYMENRKKVKQNIRKEKMCHTELWKASQNVGKAF